MAQNAAFVCRTCRSNLQQFHNHIRTFTSTAHRTKSLPAFAPTSSPELDDLLLTFRTKIFLPNVVPKRYRSLIYKQSRHDQLKDEPGVSVTLSNDEEVKLEPLNLFERPPKRPSCRRLIDLLTESSDPRDWDSIPAFLEGMALAKERLPPGWLQKLVRKAFEKDVAGIIIRSAEMVEKTHLSLADPGVSEELMLGFHLRSVKANWQGPEAEKAFKQAENIVLMMEDPEHCGGPLKEGQNDMRRSLLAMAVLLELSAGRAVHTQGGNDTDGKVISYAAKILTAVQATEFKPAKTQVERAHQLETWVPLWAGMKMALQIDELKQSPLGVRLSRELHKLDPVVKFTVERTENPEGAKKPKRSIIMYNDLEKWV